MFWIINNQDSHLYDPKYKRLQIDLSILNIEKGIQKLCIRYWNQLKYLNIQSSTISIGYIHDILQLPKYDKIEIFKFALKDASFIICIGLGYPYNALK